MLHDARFTKGQLPSIGGPLSQDAPWASDCAKHSAVCLLLIPGSHESHVVLTRRSITVGSHKGQIGLAGGRADSNDHSPAATALRETEEELGVDRTLLEVQGILPSLSALDKAPVVTVVATAPVALQDLRPNPAEVQQVFTTPWTTLTQAAAHRFSFNLFGSWRQSYHYPVTEGHVWGLTAQLLYQANFQ